MGDGADIGRIIVSDDCVAEGAEWLACRDARFARALEATGPLPLRRRPNGFAQLLSAIVSQQVSVASARAIWARLEEAGMTAPAQILASSDEALRGLGLSRQKAAYARALAEAGIDFAALRSAPVTEVVATLTAVKGIGVWTAEIYAMFSLGRADVFAPGDLALQEGARLLFELPDRPRERALRTMAEDWSPWRSVAARTLWAYYHVEKQREGIA
ncbi:DNA-3-methyladenine glycosylase 2 family protein [Aestuariicoccus sp. MJ-SS9]|uniref:DNA-3-methyladenine glycosylase family protein n=1 Tax=Aestuariicoccus sp. MJ-SS9 TaxID=3079855 RepID=UPI00290D4176|nr:DNA-3-methyladenine glycosylase 2 family protein [Aestuariicoccus sp. MJ-SS9]MDU8911044.1 DNA-3-methyladenine glycosylase 2 family protein [Aestuariicoccus sp. MJ-SS9]